MGIGIGIRGVALTAVSAAAAAAFTPQALFASGEPGFHLETYDPAALLERRNIITYSQQFDNPVWTKTTGVTVTPDTHTAPDGTVSADTVDSSAGNQVASASFTATPGYTYTASIHIKKTVGATYTPCLYLVYGATLFGLRLNTDTGVVTPMSAGGFTAPAAYSSSDEGDFWRIMLSGAASATSVDMRLYPNMNAASGVAAGSQVIWGAQMERAAAATAYQAVTDWYTEYLAAVGAAVHMWQDSAGTTPVTTVEQPCGKWDDLSGNGNHHIQATGNSRMVLKARFNHLVKSELPNDAAWIRRGAVVLAATTAPDGTGFSVTGLGAVGVNDFGQMTSGWAANAPSRPRMLIWPVSVAGTVRLANAASGVNGSWNINMALLTSGQWNVIDLDHPAVSVANAFTTTAAGGGGHHLHTTDGPLSFYLKEMDFRTNADWLLDQPTYQRVNTATDYDTEGFIHYLRADGTDDNYQGPIITLAGCNYLLTAHGLTKLSDASAQSVTELSAAWTSNAGSMHMLIDPALPSKLAAASRGDAAWSTTQIAVTNSADYNAPFTGVVIASHDITGDLSTMEIDGVVVATAVGDKGAGTFGDHVSNIGRRNNTSFPFNGRLTSVTLRGSTTEPSAALIAQLREYVAGKAGKTIAA